ncbi:hypothetical protein VIBNISOn1_p0162 [Vibrio nigripulchritudo SOn1]|uniref:Uncharacterized protein n=1 Tax=Vibrio nigripulchritudo SOn1 TaxID=1238450 RepID=A0AAV2W0G4_9VIBR|nr:hypothetical protein VIBNISOn1_p0162 [Vibrio nigripulchritudo SOn1]
MIANKNTRRGIAVKDNLLTVEFSENEEGTKSSESDMKISLFYTKRSISSNG